MCFGQGKGFIVPRPLWHRASIFAVSFEGPLVDLYDMQDELRTYAKLNPHGIIGAEWEKSQDIL